MSTETQLKLASCPSGRIFLHLACMFISGKIAWHMKGIIREF
jgi:hypothetical protein